MLFLGFSAGIPILLIFSTLGLWLNEAGVVKSTVTYFSWAALGYSFKFVWAPLVDRLSLPILTQTLGRRRAWMLLSQFSIIGAILLMSSTNPKLGVDSLTMMAYSAVLLGFSAATQDIVIDAYRIESADEKLQSMLSATYIAGYRIGMIVAGAGGMFIASYLGSSKSAYSYEAWSSAYMAMAMMMLIGVATTLIINEPQSKHIETRYAIQDYARFFLLFLFTISSFVLIFATTQDLLESVKQSLSELLNNKHFGGFVVDSLRMILALLCAYIVARILIMLNIVNKTMVDATYINPVRDFFKRYGVGIAMLLLAVIGLYRVSDIVLGVVANIFYQDIGFTKVEIATIAKIFGLFMTIIGGFVGGLIAFKIGVFRMLFLGALLSSLTNLLFVVLANVGHDIAWLYITISMDNLSAGIAGAAFVAFLSSLTNIKFSATQYSIFSSLMTLLPKMFGGYSGTLVESFGYSNFFVITTIIGIPILYLVYKVRPYID